jgi:hypothetical protein
MSGLTETEIIVMRAMKWIAKALAITMLCALARGGTVSAALQQRNLPRWINEGIADNTGFGDQADIDGLIREWQTGNLDLDLDSKRFGY